MARKNKLSYADQINREFRKAAKRRDNAAMQYYAEASGSVACVSFERFRGSWAGQNWLRKRGF
jgi:hypothetical protein